MAWFQRSPFASRSLLAPRFFVASLLVAATAAADADTTDLARRHYQSGSAYFEEGRYDDAIREFRESYRLAPRPDLLFNIAKTWDKKGDAARSAEVYREYLQARPDASDRAAVEDQIHEREALAGRVRVVDAPPRSEIAIDGWPVGTAPLAEPVAATSGHRLITARPPDGGALLRTEVDVTAGQEVTATIPPPKVEVKEVVKEKVVLKTVAPNWYTSRLGWGFVAGGALVAIGGAAMVGSSRKVQDDAGASARTEQDWRDGQSRAQLVQDLGAVLLAVGGAAVLAGALVFVVKSRHESMPIAAWIAPSLSGFSAGGTF